MDDNMEPEIHVEFPAPSSLLPEESPLFEPIWPSINSTGNTKDPEIVVILLGWAGAEHKYLCKYSDFYLKRGCITVRYITPLRHHFIQNHKLPLLAQGIVKYICELNLDSHPIFFHVFSNGGAYTYSYILKELGRSANNRLDIRGTIFDSAPCPRKLQKSYEALLTIFANLNSFKYVVAGLVIFFLVCQTFWFHLRTAFHFCLYGDTLDALENRDSQEAPLTNWLGRIVNLRNHNFLFLYSDGDDLIPADQVERFASIVASRGSTVEKLRFTGSEHVMHYRRYPKEYTEAIRIFIRSVMTTYKERSIISWD